MSYDPCNEASHAFMFTGPFRDCCPPTDATVFTLDPPGTFPPLGYVPDLTPGGPFVEPLVPVGTAGDFPPGPGKFVPAGGPTYAPPTLSALPVDPMGIVPPTLGTMTGDPFPRTRRPKKGLRSGRLQQARFGHDTGEEHKHGRRIFGLPPLVFYGTTAFMIHALIRRAEQIVDSQTSFQDRF